MLPVLDLRASADFLQGHSADSVNIPLAELPSRMYELPEKGAALRIFHDDPDQLSRAADLLAARGYHVTAVADPPLTVAGHSNLRLWRPSPLLHEALAFCSKPGRAIDLACGSGREAVCLATLGWHVDALDILPDALANAAALAARNAVEIHTIQRDLHKEGFPQEARYDLICVFRFWHPPLMPAILSSLSPGGVLAIEAFHPADQFRSAKTISESELADRAGGLDVKIARGSERNGRVFSQMVAVKG